METPMIPRAFAKEPLQKGLNRSEGQVRGIGRMVEEEQRKKFDKLIGLMEKVKR
jgi:DNA-binding FrmR family transcriptional regulator